MDGPGRMKGGMEIQGAELYPHPEAAFARAPAAELHSMAKPEKLPERNKSLDIPYS